MLLSGAGGEQSLSLAIFATAPYPMALSRLGDGVLLEVNEAFTKVFGFTREEAVGRSSLELGIFPDAERRSQFLAEIQAGGQVSGIELELRTREGESRTFLVALIVVRVGDEDYLLNTAHDITERQRAEAALRESENRFRRLSEVTFEGLAILEQGVIVDANQTFADMFGYSTQELVGMAAHEFAAPESRALVRRNILAGAEQPYEAVGLRKDGTRFWGELRGKTIAYQDRQARITVIRDTTERKRAEAVLRASEKRFRALVEKSTDAIALLDAGGVLVYRSPSAQRVFGYSDAEAIGRNFSEFIHPDELHVLTGLFAQVLRSPGNAIVTEFRYRHKCGDWRHAEATATNWLDDPHVAAVVVNVRDVTTRKQAEDATRQAEERFASAFNASPAGIAISTVDEGRILDINPGLLAMFGYAREEVLEKRPHEIDLWATPEEGEKVAAALGRDGRVANLEVQTRARSGEILDALLSVEPISLGSQRCLLSVFHDITQVKRAEKEARLLQTIALGIGTAKDLNATIDNILRLVCDATGWVMSEAWIPSVDGTRLEPHPAWYGRADGLEDFRAASAAFTFAPGVGLPGRAWRTRKPAWSEDVTRDPAFQRAELARRAGLQAGVSIPVLANDHVALVLNFFLREPRAQDQRLIELISAVAAELGVVIERKRAEDDEQQRLAELEAVNRISTALRTARSLDEMLPRLLDETLAVMSSDSGVIWLYDDQQNRLRESVARGWFTTVVEAPVPPREGIAGFVFASNQTYVSPEFFRDPRTRDSVQAKVPVGWGGACAPIRALESIIGVLFVSVKLPRELQPAEVRLLSSLAEIAGNAIQRTRLHEEVVHYAADLREAYESTIEGWSRALDLRDRETEGHTLRVTEMTLRLARAAGIPDDELTHVRRGALLHDIGKMGIPDAILLKPDRLTDEEWTVMRLHPSYAYELLSPIAYLRPALDIPYCHHERWDGAGYPRGLKGEQIPLAARLFAVVDVWDALRSDRPYRQGWSDERVREYLRDQAGTHLDPMAVRLFMEVHSRPGSEPQD